MTIDAQALRDKSRALDGAPPEEILRYALEAWPSLAISTAFGPGELRAPLHMAVGLRPDVPVFTVDTGFLFDESVALRNRFVEKYGIHLTVFEGAVTQAEQAKKHGLRLYERDTDLCCSLRKVEPTQRAVAGLDAWIAGLRRDQGESRAGLDVLELYAHADGSPLVKTTRSPRGRATTRGPTCSRTACITAAPRPGLPLHRLPPLHARRRRRANRSAPAAGAASSRSAASTRSCRARTERAPRARVRRGPRLSTCTRSA